MTDTQYDRALGDASALPDVELHHVVRRAGLHDRIGSRSRSLCDVSARQLSGRQDLIQAVDKAPRSGALCSIRVRDVGLGSWSHAVKESRNPGFNSPQAAASAPINLTMEAISVAT
jgi:hypothetical protein